jgi:sarcosine oxidase subunit gamma
MSKAQPEQPLILRPESPLYYKAGEKTDQEIVGAVVIRERKSKGFLNLRGNPEGKDFRNGVFDVLGAELPVAPRTCVSNAQVGMYWLGPDEWLLVVAKGAEAEVESRLRETLTGHFAIIDISGGQTLVELSGEKAGMVLKKSSSYDFDLTQFPVGHCAQTTFARAMALVSRRQENTFELIIRRSFADYLFDWLIDAAGEYGVEVKLDLP